MGLSATNRRQLARALAGGNKTTAALEDAFTTYDAVTAIKTAAYTAGYGQVIPVDTTAADVTITLPAPAAGEDPIVIKNLAGGVHTLTIARAGTEKIDNTAADLTTTTVGDTFRLVSNGTDWFTI